MRDKPFAFLFLKPKGAPPEGFISRQDGMLKLPRLFRTFESLRLSAEYSDTADWVFVFSVRQTNV